LIDLSVCPSDVNLSIASNNLLTCNTHSDCRFVADSDAAQKAKEIKELKAELKATRKENEALKKENRRLQSM